MESAAFASRHGALVSKAEEALRRLTPPADARPARLHAAMRHSLDAGGKRLRVPHRGMQPGRAGVRRRRDRKSVV